MLEGLDKDSDEYKEIQRLIEEYSNAESIMEDGIENTGRKLDELVKKNYTATRSGSALQRAAKIVQILLRN